MKYSFKQSGTILFGLKKAKKKLKKSVWFIHFYSFWITSLCHIIQFPKQRNTANYWEKSSTNLQKLSDNKLCNTQNKKISINQSNQHIPETKWAALLYYLSHNFLVAASLDSLQHIMLVKCTTMQSDRTSENLSRKQNKMGMEHFRSNVR